MTEEQLEAFKKIAEWHTEMNTATRAKARALLVREGIRLSDGRLAPEYGGKAPKKADTPRG